MDIRASFAAQTYAQARPATLPRTSPTEASPGFAKLATDLPMCCARVRRRRNRP
jgi:hypothetical protein